MHEATAWQCLRPPLVTEATATSPMSFSCDCQHERFELMTHNNRVETKGGEGGRVQEGQQSGGRVDKARAKKSQN